MTVIACLDTNRDVVRFKWIALKCVVQNIFEISERVVGPPDDHADFSVRAAASDDTVVTGLPSRSLTIARCASVR